MLKLEVVDTDRDHFIFSADEPARIEVMSLNRRGGILAHAYRGAEIDKGQVPIGAYNSSLGAGNRSWEKPSPYGELEPPSLSTRTVDAIYAAIVRQTGNGELARYTVAYLREVRGDQ